MFDLAARQQTTDLDQLVDDSFVGRAFAALAVQDVVSAKEWQIGAEAAVIHHVVSDDLFKHAEITVKFVFLHTVAWRTVDETGAFFICHKVGSAEITQVVPFTVRAFGTGKRMQQRQSGQFICRNRADTGPLVIFQTGFCENGLGQFVRKDVAVANIGPAFVRSGFDFVQAVVKALAVNDSFVRRDSPRRSGPDHYLRPLQVAFSGNIELHPDREAFLVVVFNLGLGQRGFLHRRPHHRLRALIESTVHQELHKFLSDHALGVEIHGQVRIVPVAGDA